jgi:hypothetical protein
MPDREKVIKGLECCVIHVNCAADGGCPYNSQAYSNCLDTAIKDALALLKAQEPRVMTLEEALGSEECWLERKDGNVTVADIALNGQDSGGYDVDSNELSTMRRYTFHSGYYGKYWRCWTSRPTDEQREKVKWK